MRKVLTGYPRSFCSCKSRNRPSITDPTAPLALARVLISPPYSAFDDFGVDVTKTTAPGGTKSIYPPPRYQYTRRKKKEKKKETRGFEQLT